MNITDQLTSSRISIISNIVSDNDTPTIQVLTTTATVHVDTILTL